MFKANVPDLYFLRAEGAKKTRQYANPAFLCASTPPKDEGVEPRPTYALLQRCALYRWPERERGPAARGIAETRECQEAHGRKFF